MWLQVFHVDMLHVLLNVCSLWGLAPAAEPPAPGGSIAYLTTSTQLAMLSSVVSHVLRYAGLPVLGSSSVPRVVRAGRDER